MASSKKSNQKNNGTTYVDSESKRKQLQQFSESVQDEYMTGNQGLKISDDQNSLKAGDRGPSLLEDFYLREKITHFDHERIPERVVHARGFAAHGYFETTKSMSEFTRAGFLQKVGTQVPVFVRFSTVAGSRGSTDLARDVRGFAVKFYTDEGNYDLVGNNIPVFFIQDAIKFPDLIHAAKPEPHNEIPQAATAHDTFWDFISSNPEAMHMIMWAMSDRAIPRSFRMMEGFGVHTFRFVNSEGKAHFVKFIWKPKLGVHSVLWDEAQQISGMDPDFHRRDLYDAIENGDYPEWELGVQLIPEEDEHKYDFDLLDPTKLVPEELVPLTIVGKMVLNRNTENFFAETEQVAFHPGHLVPGIDFTNDPLLQGRLFSYTDTQLTRLGGPNFAEIPINRPVVPVHNLQRDGLMRQTINKGKHAHHPNTIGGGCPFQAKASEGGFSSYLEKMEGSKVRARSKSFMDHYSQARLFYVSQTDIEKEHIQNALRFELGKVENMVVKERMLFHLAKVDKDLANAVAEEIGISVPTKLDEFPNLGFPADADPDDYQSKDAKLSVSDAPSLSINRNTIESAETRKVAILLAEGFDSKQLDAVKTALKKAGANPMVIAPALGEVKGSSGKEKVDFSLRTTDAVLFDGLFIPGGQECIEKLKRNKPAKEFVQKTFKHLKAIAAIGEAEEYLDDLLQKSFGIGIEDSEGVSSGEDSKVKSIADEFIKNLSGHRVWERASQLDD